MREGISIRELWQAANIMKPYQFRAWIVKQVRDIPSNVDPTIYLDNIYIGYSKKPDQK